MCGGERGDGTALSIRVQGHWPLTLCARLYFGSVYGCNSRLKTQKNIGGSM